MDVGTSDDEASSRTSCRQGQFRNKPRDMFVLIATDFLGKQERKERKEKRSIQQQAFPHQASRASRPKAPTGAWIKPLVWGLIDVTAMGFRAYAVLALCVPILSAQY